MNRKEEIEARLAAIRTELEAPDADIEALTAEVRSLKAELAGIEQQAEQRRQLREAVNNGQGTVVRSFAPAAQPESYAVDSEEYRTAWLKALLKRDLSPAEQRAYTSANGAISQLVVNDIMEVVRDHAPLMERITMVYSADKITYYVEGTSAAATAHTENATITPSDDNLTPVTLTPAEIVKMVQVSKAARRMSIPVFNSWLTKALGEAIARQINALIITAISAAATAVGTTIDTAGVQTLLGSVKGNNLAILVNRKTLYTQLLPLQDNSRNSIVRFEGTYTTARVYGVDVLVDDNMADGTVIAGDMTKAIGALGESINVTEAFDIDTNSYKYLGEALFDTKVGINAAFAKLAPG